MINQRHHPVQTIWTRASAPLDAGVKVRAREPHVTLHVAAVPRMRTHPHIGREAKRVVVVSGLDLVEDEAGVARDLAEHGGHCSAGGIVHERELAKNRNRYEFDWGEDDDCLLA